MSALAAVLAAGGGVAHVGSRPGLAVIGDRLRTAGWRVVVVDSPAVTTKETLIADLAAQLDLPDWFGHNWDALVDSLRERPMVAIVVDHASASPGPALTMLARIVAELHAEGEPLILMFRRGRTIR